MLEPVVCSTLFCVLFMCLCLENSCSVMSEVLTRYDVIAMH